MTKKRIQISFSDKMYSKNGASKRVSNISCFRNSQAHAKENPSEKFKFEESSLKNFMTQLFSVRIVKV